MVRIRYLFCGDTHGDLERAERAIDQAVALGITTIVQVGDWGFLWPGYDDVDRLSDLHTRHQIMQRVICGNHDDHPRLRALPTGDHNIAPYLTYHPRGSVFEDTDGTRFLFLGGAPSIDREHRTPGLSWWPEEQISEGDLQRALAVPGPIHALVTHDAPDLPPGISADAGSPQFQLAARRSTTAIFTVMQAFRPDVLVHGHYHRRYARVMHGTIVEGLASNLQRFEDLTFVWSREP